MPFVYYQAMNIHRLDNKDLPIFAISYIFLVLILAYIYHETEKLRNSEWKYVVMQTLFGLSWWIFLLWVDHSFPAVEILNMLAVFLIYMGIIRFCEKKLEDTMLNYDDLNNFEELFDRVDSYLYKSKNDGRNRLTVEGITYNFDDIN